MPVIIYEVVIILCSNRTFMELKFGWRLTPPPLVPVLIVPLWNWNGGRPSYFCLGCCSNRTFMELKLTKAFQYGFGMPSSNRTFMELKLDWFYWCHVRLYVLIVPLWNWNLVKNVFQYTPSRVLIVPLWNWNNKSFDMPMPISRSNRTFMELKSPHDAFTFDANQF